MLGMACPPTAGVDKADEDAAVAALERLGGAVSRDSTLPGRPAIRLHIGYSRCTDASLKLISRLTRLEYLAIPGAL
jgi:hypothetical protein